MDSKISIDGCESDFNAEAQSRRDAQSGVIDISGALPQTPTIDSKEQNISQSESSLRSSAPLRLCVKNAPTTHCVRKIKRIFDGDKVIEAEHINGYLMDGPDVWVESRTKPICDVPNVIKGSSPVDDGNFFLTKEDVDELIEKEPKAQKYIKRFYGAREYLHSIDRWCLWLEGASPSELKSMPDIMSRIAKVRDFRLKSTKDATRKYADYPTRFMEMRQPKTDYILIPRHSSEGRKYIPFGFMSCDVICGDANNMIPNASLFHFGVLTSSVHMAWVSCVCGRIKSDYRYSNDIVYNNFPWPEVDNVANVKMLPIPNTNTQLETGNIGTGNTSTMATISTTAQSILDARALYPDSSLADLYDPLTMPIELRKAHAANDAAVMKAYGYAPTMTEPEIVADLMKRYQNLTAK